MTPFLNIKARPHEVQKFNSPTTSQIYQYRTLQQKGWFRVLVIEPSNDPDERISCNLIHLPLHHTTHYEALSYTWGDEKAEYPMLIDGNVFYVRHNLYCALRQLRLTSMARMLWIDAICINQNDVPERGSQVAQMGDVYSMAECVVVWLGEGTEHTDLGFEAMAQYFHISSAINKADVTAALSDSEIVALGFSEFLKLPNMDRYLLGIIGLYIAPWWRRVWTVQEISLARQIEVHYGRRSIEWDRIHIFSTAMMLPAVQTVLSRYTPRTELGRTTLKALKGHMTQRAYSMENIRKQLRSDKLSLSLLIRVTVGRYATDPRDKIYGLLGMAEYVPSLQPDYALSVAEVYIAATKTILYQNRDLRIFSTLMDDSSTRQPGLPSWVMDFHNLSKTRSSATISGLVEGQCGRCYSAAPSLGLDADFIQEHVTNDRLLKIKGIEVDVVRTVGAYAPFTELEKLELAQNPFWPNITGWKSSLKLTSGQYLTGETTLAAFWRTLLVDKKVAGYHPSFSGQLNEAGNIRLEKIDTLVPPRTLDQEQQLAVALTAPFGQMSHLCNRSFAVSEKGYFTLLPRNARQGDVLYVLAGGEVPYLLRPLSGGTFQMLGECYIHGMMDGEIARGPEAILAYHYLTLQ